MLILQVLVSMENVSVGITIRQVIIVMYALEVTLVPIVKIVPLVLQKTHKMGQHAWPIVIQLVIEVIVLALIFVNAIQVGMEPHAMFVLKDIVVQMLLAIFYAT